MSVPHPPPGPSVGDRPSQIDPTSPKSRQSSRDREQRRFPPRAIPMLSEPSRRSNPPPTRRNQQSKDWGPNRNFSKSNSPATKTPRRLPERRQLLPKQIARSTPQNGPV